MDIGLILACKARWPLITEKTTIQECRPADQNFMGMRILLSANSKPAIHLVDMSYTIGDHYVGYDPQTDILFIQDKA